MNKIITDIKSNFRYIYLFYLITSFICLVFFLPDSQMWTGPKFHGTETDRWFYIRIFQLLTLILIGYSIFEIQEEYKEYRLKSIPIIFFIHFCTLVYTFMLDFSFQHHRQEIQPLAKWYPGFFFIFGIILTGILIKISITVEKKNVYPDLIFLIIAWFFSNSKNHLSEILFNLSFGFLFLALLYMSFVRYFMYVENTSIQKDKKNAFFGIFAVGFWIFLVTAFSVMAKTNINDFSFISIYLLFCIFGLLYFLSTNATFSVILFSVFFLTSVVYGCLKILQLIETNNLTDIYKLPLIISTILISISLFGVSYFRIKE